MLDVFLLCTQLPSCLILQMPRFGSKYKMYDMILPNLELDVTHIVENSKDNTVHFLISCNISLITKQTKLFTLTSPEMT